nr:MAG TPA: hypothetical protein [Caudoviricetes sp.]
MLFCTIQVVYQIFSKMYQYRHRQIMLHQED